jgi:hypothetical protein
LTERTEKTALLARVRSSPEYAARLSPARIARLPKYGGVQKAFLIVFFVMFIGGAGLMFVIALGMAGLFGFVGGHGGFSLIPLVMSLFPLGFVALGIFLFLMTRKKMDSIENDPVQALPVIVVDKRAHVSGGSGDSSASTHYFVTCEAEDGTRNEYQVWDGNLYGRMASGDAGILFLRAGYGLDFDRVR